MIDQALSVVPSYRLSTATELPSGIDDPAAYYAPHLNLVKRLTTREGVSASEGGMFDKAYFTRDGTYAGLMILAHWERDMRDYGTSPVTDLVLDQMAAHLYLEQYVGTEEAPSRGELPGQWPHEVRLGNHDRLTDPMQIPPTQRAPFYVNPEGVMVTYEALDATSLAVYYIGRLAEAGF